MAADKILKKLKVVSEEGDKKVYSGDEIMSLNDRQRELVVNNLSSRLMISPGELMGELETKNIEVSPDTVTLVDREEDPTIGGKKLRLKKKTRRAKRNRRTMKRRQLH